MKLTIVAVKNAKTKEKLYRLFDGGGLYLEVNPQGGKYWRFKYRFNNKERRMGFGVFPTIGLAEAREKRMEAKKKLDKGLDPAEVRKLAKLERQVDYENNFQNIAREWHEQRRHTWKPIHAERIIKRLEADVFPTIGNRPIKVVRPPELLVAIRKIEERGNNDLAHRVMQTCSQVFRYAVATGRAEHDVTADLKGALKPVKSKNLSHLSEGELPGFLSKLERYEEDYRGNRLTKLAFKLLILTFVRSGEIRGAMWNEIDFDKAQWRIPAERMKAKDIHIVPLSKQSITILKEIQEISGQHYSNYVFPSQQNPRRTMSENTFLRAIEIMGYRGETTGHGFRSTASTILNENGHRPDVIERQLAHAERDQVRAAYNHAEYLPERTGMMQWWGDYIENITITKTANI